MLLFQVDFHLFVIFYLFYDIYTVNIRVADEGIEDEQEDPDYEEEFDEEQGKS